MRFSRPRVSSSVVILPTPEFSLQLPISVTNCFLKSIEKTVPWKESVTTKDAPLMHFIQFSSVPMLVRGYSIFSLMLADALPAVTGPYPSLLYMASIPPKFTANIM